MSDEQTTTAEIARVFETPIQALLIALNPIVTCYVESGSPCGDPMGLKHWAVSLRLSDVMEQDPAIWSRSVRAELDRLGWNHR